MHRFFRRSFGRILLASSCLFLTQVASAQVLVDSLTPVEIWALHGDAPSDGVFATEIMIATTGGFQVRSIDRLSIDGAIHQVWSPDAEIDTPFGIPPDNPLFNAVWNRFDSHLLLGASQPGLGESIRESNDGAKGVPLPSTGSEVAPLTGFGGIELTEPISLGASQQADRFRLAYLVSSVLDSGDHGDIRLTLGVQGNYPSLDENVSVVFEDVPVFLTVPEPQIHGWFAALALAGWARGRRRSCGR